MNVDTPRAMKREREESLSLSSSSRRFARLLCRSFLSLEIETKRDSDDVRKKNWREGRKSFRERAAPLLSLFFDFSRLSAAELLSCSPALEFSSRVLLFLFRIKKKKIGVVCQKTHNIKKKDVG